MRPRREEFGLSRQGTPGVLVDRGLVVARGGHEGTMLILGSGAEFVSLRSVLEKGALNVAGGGDTTRPSSEARGRLLDLDKSTGSLS